ncbi:MAG TPA: hypothetical protein PLP83_10180 [Candidatus Aminicenantes bacterium]|nr:hypothetical protein [Candidatus Aminicenantes bacterium]
MKGIEFERIWRRILDYLGEIFQTVAGLDFVYRVQGDALNTNRTKYNLSKSNFRAAYELMPVPQPGKISQITRGSSYVWANLNDPRIKGDPQ